jgi:hypothetical protein
MPSNDRGPAFEHFMAAAEAVAAERPDVDLDLAREVLEEAAILLHHGLAFDGLDEHDTDAVISGLCSDLVSPDPGAAVRARSQHALDDPGDHLHDPEAVAAACLVAAWILQL